MLSATSKVHELFSGLYETVDNKHARNVYTTILRDLIHSHIISGKTTLREFFDPETVTTWMGYVMASYGEMDAREFYSALLDVHKDFDVTGVNEFIDDDAKDHEIESESEDEESEYEESETESETESDDEDEEDEALMRKAKWENLMKPLAKEIAADGVAPDALVKIMWQWLVDPSSLDALYNMGRTLYVKSIDW